MSGACRGLSFKGNTFFFIERHISLVFALSRWTQLNIALNLCVAQSEQSGCRLSIASCIVEVVYIVHSRNILLCFGCKILGDTAAVNGVTRYPSLPILPMPGAVKKELPVPVPRRNPSASLEWGSANNLKNDVSVNSAPNSGLSANLEIGVKANSCHDLRTTCTAVDRHGHENSSVQVDELQSSTAADSCGISAVDAASSINCTVKHLVSDSVYPVKPPRSKRRLKKELLENVGTSDMEKSSSITVHKVDLVCENESPAVQQNNVSFPQPKPRISLLQSHTLQLDKAGQMRRQQLHNASCEFAVENNAVTSMDFTSQEHGSDRNTHRIASVHVEGGNTDDKMNEDKEWSLDGQQLADHEIGRASCRERV